MHVETSGCVRLTTLFQSEAAHSTHWNLCNKMLLYVQELNTNNVCSKPFHEFSFITCKSLCTLQMEGQLFK